MTDTSGHSDWQVRGTAAENYEKYLVPALFAAWVPGLLDAGGVASGHRVLDVACGTGIVARGAAERVGATGRVVGLDLNPGMVEAARAADVTGAVEWQVGDATALPFEAGEFDVVLCQQGFQFVPDPVRAAGEMGRVAGAGTVAVAVWAGLDRNPVWASFADLLGRHAGPEAAEIMRSPFGFGGPDRLRHVFGQAGYGDVQVEEATGEARFDSPEAMVREEAISSPLAEPLGELDADEWTALVEDTGRLLAEHQHNGRISFPMGNLMVSARI